MMDNLERLNILPRIMSASKSVALETVSLQEEVKPVETAAFGNHILLVKYK